MHTISKPKKSLSTQNLWISTIEILLFLLVAKLLNNFNVLEIDFNIHIEIDNPL